MRQKIVKGSHSLMKGLNKSSVLNIIRSYGPISRADIAQKLNASIPTATRITDSLLQKGLIISAGPGASSGGRKAPTFEINPEGAYIFGVQVGENIGIVLTNLKAEVLDASSYPIVQFEDPEDIFKKIGREIDSMISKNKVPSSKVYGVGMGIPGINFRAKSVIEKSVFKGWNKIDINTLTKKYIKFETFIENIAYTTTLKEYWFGAGKGYSNIVHLLVDIGIGGGVILDGKLYKGVNGKAGIMGHISVDFDGEECYCGNKGCVETYSSVPAIVRKVKKLISDGIPSSLSEKHPSISKITFEDICREADRGDVLSHKVLKEAGQRLGAATAVLANVFDPELIILSGEAISKSALLYETARSEALERIFTFIDINKRLEIKPGKAEIPGPLGCIALVLQLIFQQRI